MRTYRPLTRAGLALVALAAWSAAAAAVEIDPGLPPESTTVLMVNLKQLRHAPVIKQNASPVLQKACKDTAPVREALEALGFDPFHDLDSLTIAGVPQGKKEGCVFILRGRFDTARCQTAVGRLVKEHGERFTAHKADGLKYYSVVSSGEHGSIQFGAGTSSSKGTVLNVKTTGCLLDLLGGTCVTLADKNTLIAASSAELLKQACEQVRGKPRATLNKPMRRLLADLDGKHTVVFAMLPGNCEAAQRMPVKPVAAAGRSEEQEVPLPPPPVPYAYAPPPPPPPPPLPSDAPPHTPLRDLSGTITLAEDFTLKCTLRAASLDDAKEVMKGFKEARLRMGGLMTLWAGSSKEYAFLKEIPRSFVAVRKGRIILVEGHLPAETLEKLCEMCKSAPKN